ncbi:sugar phosphate isomerase/epimerase [Oscillospiraceae bacterium PP1C4]
MFKIGTLADWFGVGLLEGIKESQRCGAQGVQIYAWNELNPLTITAAELNKVKSVASDCKQEITALCAELGGHGLEIAADNAKKLDYLKRTIDIALELDCNVITTHIGIIPEDTSCDKYKIMQAACSQIGAYAKQHGAYVAVETGPEPIARLSKFIDSCEGSMAVNYDPANLVMVTNDDEVQGVYTAGSKIVHTHAKDGVCNFFAGCETVYGIFADGGIEALNTVSTYFTEMPLGQGNVRWIPYLTALKETGYKGYLTIEREVGKNAGADIRLAVDFLNNILEKI